jgi:putative glutamine amidotransferase
MRRALIGVTTSVKPAGQAPERAYVNAAYLRAVQAAGGVPVLLPPHLDAESLTALRDRLDGLLLTGGGDIAPARFGEVPQPKVDDVSEARDALEIDLALHAVDRGVPLLAICRGVQVLNVALGGSLYQDIASDLGTGITHAQTAPRSTPTHPVTVQGESRLAQTLGALEASVNSMHHQALKKLGRGLREVAWAPDGVIEGLEAPEAPGFVLGVQWHPEDLVGHDPGARALFRALVDASRSR